MAQNSSSEKKLAVSAVNFMWINDQFCTAGQPSFEDLKNLKKKGLKGVLNLKIPGESTILEQEKQHAETLRLKYFNIPVDSSNLQNTQVDQFLSIVKDTTNRPLLIHCQSANRVGAFWMIYRVVIDQWAREKAEKEAHKIGLRSPILAQFAYQYIKSYRNNRSKKSF